MFFRPVQANPNPQTQTQAFSQLMDPIDSTVEKLQVLRSQGDKLCLFIGYAANERISERPGEVGVSLDRSEDTEYPVEKFQLLPPQEKGKRVHIQLDFNDPSFSKINGLFHTVIIGLSVIQFYKLSDIWRTMGRLLDGSHDAQLISELVEKNDTDEMPLDEGIQQRVEEKFLEDHCQESFKKEKADWESKFGAEVYEAMGSEKFVEGLIKGRIRKEIVDALEVEHYEPCPYTHHIRKPFGSMQKLSEEERAKDIQRKMDCVHKYVSTLFDSVELIKVEEASYPAPTGFRPLHGIYMIATGPKPEIHSDLSPDLLKTYKHDK